MQSLWPLLQTRRYIQCTGTRMYSPTRSKTKAGVLNMAVLVGKHSNVFGLLFKFTLKSVVLSWLFYDLVFLSGLFSSFFFSCILLSILLLSFLSLFSHLYWTCCSGRLAWKEEFWPATAAEYTLHLLWTLSKRALWLFDPDLRQAYVAAVPKVDIPNGPMWSILLCMDLLFMMSHSSLQQHAQ